MVGVASVHDGFHHDLVAKVVVTCVLVKNCVMIHLGKALGVSCNELLDDVSEAATVSSEDTRLAVVSSPAMPPADYR